MEKDADAAISPAIDVEDIGGGLVRCRRCLNCRALAKL
jgi:hypothetical protein